MILSLSNQVRTQYAKNAAQLQEMADAATHHPSGTHRGQTAAYWQGKANTYHKMATTGIPCQELQDMIARLGVTSELAKPNPA